MMRGMTGFAEKSYAARSLRVKISIKTLTHRFFDWSYKGTPIGETEAKLRGLCQKHIRRGRVEVFLDITSVDPESWEFSINEGLLEKIHAALGRVSRRTGHRLEFPAEIHTHVGKLRAALHPLQNLRRAPHGPQPGH